MNSGRGLTGLREFGWLLWRWYYAFVVCPVGSRVNEQLKCSVHPAVPVNRICVYPGVAPHPPPGLQPIHELLDRIIHSLSVDDKRESSVRRRPRPRRVVNSGRCGAEDVREIQSVYINICHSTTFISSKHLYMHHSLKYRIFILFTCIVDIVV